MELIQGASLQDSLGRGRLDPRTAAALVAKLADALQAVHEVGLLHRDIKPDNVLLRPDGDPLLTDFGLALHAADERLTRTGAFVGTPGYLPPEQAAGDRERVGVPSDVYALGAVLYACLTGEPPHGSLDMVQALLAAERLPEPPSSKVDGLPAELDAICLRCLQPDPRARYPDARALGGELGAFLAGQAARPGSRRRLAPVLAVSAAALGLGVLAWGRGGSPRTPPPPSRSPSAPPTPTPTPTRLPPALRHPQSTARPSPPGTTQRRRGRRVCACAKRSAGGRRSPRSSSPTPATSQGPSGSGSDRGSVSVCSRASSTPPTSSPAPSATWPASRSWSRS